eukprot:1777033-Rhodomonas_salina.1
MRERWTLREESEPDRLRPKGTQHCENAALRHTNGRQNGKTRRMMMMMMMMMDARVVEATSRGTQCCEIAALIRGLTREGCEV